MEDLNELKAAIELRFRIAELEAENARIRKVVDAVREMGAWVSASLDDTSCIEYREARENFLTAMYELDKERE